MGERRDRGGREGAGEGKGETSDHLLALVRLINFFFPTRTMVALDLVPSTHSNSLICMFYG